MFNDSISVQVRRCVTMPQNFHNFILATEFLNQLCQRLLLFRSSGIGRFPMFIQPTDVTDTNAAVVVAYAGKSLAVSVRPVNGERTADFYSAIQSYHIVVPNRAEPSLQVHLGDFLLTNILPSFCGRAVNYY